MRRAIVDRRTTETQIALTIAIEGRGRYAVQSGIRAGNRGGTSTVRTVNADRYPGLRADPVQTVPLPLSGAPQTVLNPPGGYPAAITTVPGVASP